MRVSRNAGIYAFALALALLGSVEAQQAPAPDGRDPLVLPHDPDHADKAVAWCAVHIARLEIELALSDCNYAVAREPRNATALSNRGSAYLLSGDTGKALVDFEAALRLKPDDATLYFNRGLSHAAAGSREAAIKDYAEAIRIRPDFAVAYHNRGYEHELSGHRDQAIADYRRALEIEPKLQPSIDALLRLVGHL